MHSANFQNNVTVRIEVLFSSNVQPPATTIGDFQSCRAFQHCRDSQNGFDTLELLRLAILFAITALAEIVGCYLPWLVLKQGKSLLLLLPAAISLGIFAWLLTLHPTAAGRTYAAYGGMYIAVALLWLRFVDGISLTRWDLSGAAVALLGMTIIALQPATN